MSANSSRSLLDHLVLERYLITFQAQEPITLPPFSGAHLRGAFGRALRWISCTTGLPVCPGCSLIHSCPYAYLFETPLAHPRAPRRFQAAAPYPYVLQVVDPQVEVPPGEHYTFGLTLIGTGADYLPLILLALTEMGRRGLGWRRPDREQSDSQWSNSRGRAHLVGIEALLPDGQHAIYDPQAKTLLATPGRWTTTDFLAAAESLQQCLAAGGTLRLQLQTPTRLKEGGQPVTSLEFVPFMKALLRRLSALVRFHCGGSIPESTAELLLRAESVQATGALEWRSQERFSARQNRRMNLGGLVGSVTLTGDLQPFLPFLVAGQYTHVGKNTTFGLGEYQLLMEGVK